MRRTSLGYVGAATRPRVRKQQELVSVRTKPAVMPATGVRSMQQSLSQVMLNAARKESPTRVLIEEEEICDSSTVFTYPYHT